MAPTQLEIGSPLLHGSKLFGCGVYIEFAITKEPLECRVVKCREARRLHSLLQLPKGLWHHDIAHIFILFGFHTSKMMQF